MIICSTCGFGIEDFQSFCRECGAPNPLAPRPVTPIPPAGTQTTVPPNVQVNTYHPPVAPAPPVFAPPPPGTVVPAPQPRRMKGVVLALIGLFVVAVIAVAVYFAVAPNKADEFAENLKSKVRQGSLVSPSGSGDAYEDYSKLKNADPNHETLRELRSEMLSKLRSLGDEVFRRKTRVDPTASDGLTESDWARTARVYQWAQELDSSDKTLGARRRFAEGETAKIQAKRADDARDFALAQSKRDEAERGYRAAFEIDSTWAVPQNSLGLLIVENIGIKRPKDRCFKAIEFYDRAIQLDPQWEIPYNNLGTAYYILGKDYDDQAERSYRRAIDLNSSWARPHYWLGELYERKGPEWKYTALEEYQTAQRLGKDNLPITAQQLENKIQKLQS